MPCGSHGQRDRHQEIEKLLFDVTCCQEGEVGAIVVSRQGVSTQLSWSCIARCVA
jgi:hypothetical protein